MEREVDDEMPQVVVRDDKTMQAFRDMFTEEDSKRIDDGYIYPDEDETLELRNDVPIGKLHLTTSTSSHSRLCMFSPRACAAQRTVTSGWGESDLPRRLSYIFHLNKHRIRLYKT